MTRAGTTNWRKAPGAVRLSITALALALALSLVAAAGCSAPPATDADGPTPPAAAADAPSDAAASGARARLEAALKSVTATTRKPGAEQIREALEAAGFPPDSVEATASRTPTGLDADAVEAAVKGGRSCIVAQLRNGSVTAAVLPVIADGRCLVGSAG